MTTTLEIYSLSSKTIDQIIQQTSKNEKIIEKKLGQIGLAVFKKQKHIVFTPIHQQPLKRKIGNFFIAHPSRYKYKPDKSLRQNIIEYTFVAHEFSKREFQYLFGDYGVEIMYAMRDYLDYFKQIKDTQITDQQWKKFTKTR